MRLVWSLIAGAAAALLPVQVLAQTAEDTVAFILYGVENGAQQFEVSVDFNSSSVRMQKKARSIWRREANGLYTIHVERGDYSSTLQIAVRRSSNCEYTLTVASKTSDPDYDDEAHIIVDFSKISSIIYSSGQSEMGLREFAGPLRIEVSGPNAICYDSRRDLAPSRARTKTECLDKGQHKFPTLLPFFGLSRPLERHESAVSFFRQKICPAQTP